MKVYDRFWTRINSYKGDPLFFPRDNSKNMFMELTPHVSVSAIGDQIVFRVNLSKTSYFRFATCGSRFDLYINDNCVLTKTKPK